MIIEKKFVTLQFKNIFSSIWNLLNLWKVRLIDSNKQEYRTKKRIYYAMKKIVMILPYFGKLPNYFSLFLLSCKNNPEIDWLLYTDSQVQSPASNIKINHCSFDIFVERIRKSIPFPITLTSPYDLCDFKPTYG